MPDLHRTTLAFSQLNGWAADDHAAALSVFRQTSDALAGDWIAAIDAAPDPRAFFETHFDPVLITDGKPCLFTGYYEPEISASRSQTPDFPVPIYALPADMPTDRPWYSRKEIEISNRLAGSEIAWLPDRVEVFFLQVQGSGRLCFADGSRLRVGFAGKNGHHYTSVGKILVARNIVSAADISADFIRQWVRENPGGGYDLLWQNNSYVFFRPLHDLSDVAGPLGVLGKSVTPGRSLAVDPGFTPYGSPVWIEKDAPDPMARLCVAQDTGSAIKGPQRADIFFGTGPDAGTRASRTKDTGRMIVLVPKRVP